MNQYHPLPPIKATEPGKHGRKHTIAQARLNPDGKVEVSMLCSKSGCGCSGWFDLEDLLEDYKRLLEGKENEKEKEAA